MYIISQLRAIPHVEIIRIGSRTPVVMPQRITPELCNMLKKYMTLTAEEEEGVAKCLSTLRMAFTPYYLSLIDPTDPEDPVRKQAIST